MKIINLYDFSLFSSVYVSLCFVHDSIYHCKLQTMTTRVYLYFFYADETISWLWLGGKGTYCLLWLRSLLIKVVNCGRGYGFIVQLIPVSLNCAHEERVFCFELLVHLVFRNTCCFSIVFLLCYHFWSLQISSIWSCVPVCRCQTIFWQDGWDQSLRNPVQDHQPLACSTWF